MGRVGGNHSLLVDYLPHGGRDDPSVQDLGSFGPQDEKKRPSADMEATCPGSPGQRLYRMLSIVRPGPCHLVLTYLL